MIAATFATLTLFAGTPVVAYADDPVAGSGAFAIAISPVLERVADGNTFMDYTFTESTVGIWNGTRVGSGELVIHPDGSLNTSNTGIFTGTIAGRSGTAVIHAAGSGTFSAAEASGTITDGTAGLAGVHAELRAAGSATGPGILAGTYSIKVTFGAPQP